MSLLKLLSVGHSFVGMNEDRSRFKMTQENLLPRFAPLRRSEDRPEDHRPKVFQNSSAIPQRLGGDKPAASATSPSRHSSLTNGLDQAQSAPTPPAPVPSAGGTGHRPPHLFHLASKPPAKKPLGQPELSLDGVKVVRNDLSTADLELVSPSVPVPAQEAAGGVSLSPGPSKIELTALAWNRLTSRLFDYRISS